MSNATITVGSTVRLRAQYGSKVGTVVGRNAGIAVLIEWHDTGRQVWENVRCIELAK